MRKFSIFSLVFCFIFLSGCGQKELKNLRIENNSLKKQLAEHHQKLNAQEKIIAKLKETAEYHYQLGMVFLSTNKYNEAKVEFGSVIENYPTSPFVLSAKQQLLNIDKKLKIIEEQHRVEAKRKQKEKKHSWQVKVKEFENQILEQALWDFGHGTRTLVIDVITKNIGKPSDSYEALYGMLRYYVWGVSLSSNPSSEELKKAPFYIIISRNQMCGDYKASPCEYYSYGEQISVSRY